jgi:hypothetical protein
MAYLVLALVIIIGFLCFMVVCAEERINELEAERVALWKEIKQAKEAAYVPGEPT